MASRLTGSLVAPSPKSDTLRVLQSPYRKSRGLLPPHLSRRKPSVATRHLDRYTPAIRHVAEGMAG